jgi:hypothetical protein
VRELKNQYSHGPCIKNVHFRIRVKHFQNPGRLYQTRMQEAIFETEQNLQETPNGVHVREPI